MGNDGFANVGLPDTHLRHAVVRHPRSIHQSVADSEGPDGRRQVAAVAAPVDKCLVNGDLAKQVVDVVIGPAAARHDHGFAGAGTGATHAINLFGVGVGAADDAQQQGVTGGASLLCPRRQVLQAEEHALAGAATQVGGGDADLCDVGHWAGYSVLG